MANTRTYDWETIVALDEEVHDEARDIHPAYEFSQRTFYEDDKSGVYTDDA